MVYCCSYHFSKVIFTFPIYTVSTSFDVCRSRWDSFGTSDFGAVCVQWRGWLWAFGSSEGAKVDCLQQQEEKTKPAAAATNNQQPATTKNNMSRTRTHVQYILYTVYVYSEYYIYKYTLTNKNLAPPTKKANIHLLSSCEVQSLELNCGLWKWSCTGLRT